MSEFLITFSVSAQSAQGIAAQLNLKGGNAILFDRGIQLLPLWQDTPMPALSLVKVDSRSVEINSHDGGKSDQQGLSISFAVSANGPALRGDIPATSGPELSYAYSFVGHDQQGALQVGSFSIPFPST